MARGDGRLHRRHAARRFTASRRAPGDLTLDPWLIGAAVAMGMVDQPDRGGDSGAQRGRRRSGEGAAEGRIPVAERRRESRAAALGASRARRRRWSRSLFSRIGIMFYAGFVLAVLAAVLLSPALSLWLARALRPLLAWLRPVEGTLAADSLIQAPRRTSGTVAALMLSLALVISLGGLARASYDSLSEWMRIALNPDLFVTTAETLTSRSFVFPASLATDSAAIDGVAEVQPVRSVRVHGQERADHAGRADIAFAGNGARICRRSRAIRKRCIGWPRGEGRDGFGEFRAAARCAHWARCWRSPRPPACCACRSSASCAIFPTSRAAAAEPRDCFIRYWHDDSVNVFRVYLTPGADAAQVRQRILDAFGSQQRLFVLTNRDVRDFITRLTDQWFGLTYVQIAVAVLVAVLGIVNALTVSITDRRRELGVLQAVGGLRNQIRHTIWMEAVAIGIIGLALGLVLGAIQLYYSVEIARGIWSASRLAYAYPFQTALALIPVILGAAFLAALGTGGERGARIAGGGAGI